MTTAQIPAAKGEIADRILVAGDPLRAKYVAETFLEDPVCFNRVRNSLGFTGTYKGVRVSVMGTGMGMPSTALYVNELCMFFDVQKIMRIGTCGSFDENTPVGSVKLVMAASTDSNMNYRYFKADYAASCNFELLNTCYNTAKENGYDVGVCSVLSSDTFYKDDPNEWKKWKEYGVSHVEMESNIIYTIAAKFKRQALTVLTVSDNIITGKEMSSDQREKSIDDMALIALDTIIK